MRLALTAIVGSSHTVELKTTTTNELLVRTEDLPTVLRTIEETWSTTTHTNFQGSNWKKVLAETTLNVGSNGVVTIRLGGSIVTNGTDHTNSVIGGATWAQYQFLGGPGKLSTSINSGTAGGYSINSRYEWPINKQLSGFVGGGLVHPAIGKDNIGMMAGVSMTFGGNNDTQFHRGDI